MTRLLAIDHGSRRIGLAIGDTETGMAFARPALHRVREADDLETIRRLAADEDASLIIVGLPRNMDGSAGPQAAAARRFGERLAALGVEVVYVDERLTTWQAEREVGPAHGATRRSGEVDSAAARIILQDYLAADAAPPSSLEAE